MIKKMISYNTENKAIEEGFKVVDHHKRAREQQGYRQRYRLPDKEFSRMTQGLSARPNELETVYIRGFKERALYNKSQEDEGATAGPERYIEKAHSPCERRWRRDRGSEDTFKIKRKETVQTQKGEGIEIERDIDMDEEEYVENMNIEEIEE